MNIKEAKKIIVSLSKPEKMPGFAYGIPAAECKTGSKLRLIPNSVCSDCYALKNNYTRFPAIVQAQYKRLESIQNPLWVEAMAVVINSKAVKDFSNTSRKKTNKPTSAQACKLSSGHKMATFLIY